MTGSNELTLPTETLEILERRAALAGMEPSAFLELVIEGLEAGEFWDEAIDASPIPLPEVP